MLRSGPRVSLAITGFKGIDGCAMAQGQVLRARGCAQWIRLYETKPGNRAPQGGRFEQAARQGVATQLIDGRGHDALLLFGDCD